MNGSCFTPGCETEIGGLDYCGNCREMNDCVTRDYLRRIGAQSRDSQSARRLRTVSR